MPTLQSLTIVDEKGQVVLELDAKGITFTAPNGKKAVIKLERGTDSGSVKLVAQYEPSGVAAIGIIDNII